MTVIEGYVVLGRECVTRYSHRVVGVRCVRTFSTLAALLHTLAASAQPEDPPPMEVEAESDQLEDANTGMSRAEVRELPGAFGDPFRAIESMPGVTPMVSGLPFFFVRGAPPGNVGYFLDGVRVPVLYHVGFGPSVLHPALVEDVHLYSGAYPARFGRFAGGIVTADTVEPQPQWHGEGNIRVFDAGALIEGGLFDDKLIVMAGGRYSYTGLILSLVSPQVELSYWDYQARVAWNVSRRDRFTVLAFGASDLLAGEESDGSTNTVIDNQFHRIDVRYDRLLEDGGTSRVATTFGYDVNGFGSSAETAGNLFGGRVELVKPLSKRWTLRSGADVNLRMFQVNAPESFQDIFPARNDVNTGVYGDVVYEFMRGGTITPGMRVDYYASDDDKAVAIEPRLLMKVPITDDVRLLPAVGLAHQAPSFLPVAGFQVAGLDQGLQQSVQQSFGVEMDLPEEITLRLTAFHNIFLNLIDPFGIDLEQEVEQQASGDSVDDDSDEFGFRDLLEPAVGRSYGIEVYLRRRLTKHLGGFLSYTLSRADRCVRRFCGASTFDRTHTLSAALALDFGAGWRGGMKHVFYSGRPASGDPSQRTFPFYRLDLRLEKRWYVAEHVMIALVAEWLNATLRSEVTALECTPGAPCEPVVIGPVTIPSLGVEAAF